MKGRPNDYVVKFWCCQDKHFLIPVICYLKDVVNTWKAYDSHLEDDMKHGPLFISPIENLVSKVWYKKRSRVSIHTISHWLKVMVEDVTRVEGRVTNKNDRRTTITRMFLAKVP